MRSPRRLCAALILVPLVAAGCTGGSGSKPSSSSESKPISTPTTTVAPPTSTAPSTSATRTPSTTPKGSVPVDQIPPSHPLQWVPAGVPTKAKYKELGDVVPRFNEIMFQNSAAGALATVRYFIDALNWDSAVPHSTRAYDIVCTTSICKQFAQESQKQSRLGQHITGDRIRPTSSFTVTVAPASSGAKWIVQFQLTTNAGSELSAAGHVVARSRQSSFDDALFLSWNGKRWIITDDREVVK